MLVRKPSLKKIVGPMEIFEYPINSNFTGTLISINGKHGLMKSLGEDRVYFVLNGSGKFIVGGEECSVKKDDMVFVPKGTTYDVEGKMEYFLLCSPKFNPKNDVFLEK